jgi:hypothetical protein
MKQHADIANEPGAFFTLLIGAAVLALMVVAGDSSWLTGRLASDIALLLILWRVFAYALAAVLVFLHRRFMAFWLGAPARREASAPEPAEGEPAATAEPPDNEMLLRYLALRATLQWHYRADPYGKDGGEVADNYRPTELILSRHVCEKLTAWAERNAASLSDAAERMILNGMADEHLAHIVREDGWAEWEDESR